MGEPDFEGAKQYALNRLAHELPSSLLYHSIHHTRDDVANAAMRLAALESVTGADLMLLMTAVYFHDIGFIYRRLGHELLGIQIAHEVLPQYGYDSEQIEIIGGVILATRLPHVVHTLLESIIADADLDVLGRDDFLARNMDLRTELIAEGSIVRDEEWYGGQLAFISSHRYFTQSARNLRDTHKVQNVALMTRLLAECRTRPVNSQTSAAVSRPRGPTMLTLSTNEKITLLRSVNIFAGTPDHLLSEVSDLLTPMEVAAGAPLLTKGQPGDCMYILVSGRLRAHDGERLLNYIGPYEVVGFMALLDSEPRSASVTAEMDTMVLRLDQEPFYQLMANRMEVARGTIRVLCQLLRARIRDMNQDYQYIQQMERVTAAAAMLENGSYTSQGIEHVMERTDALGQLARVFNKMASEVQAREARLKQQVEELRIQIDESKRAREVAEITESEYFQDLQKKVKKLRAR